MSYNSPRKESNRRYYLENKKRILAKNKKWKEENWDKVLAASRRYRKKYPEKTRNAKLKHDHGITLKQYNKMYKKQNSRCAVCNKKEKILHIDHCHKTGLTRMLLCRGCNTGLGYFRDSIQLIKRAIKYLKEFK